MNSGSADLPLVVDLGEMPVAVHRKPIGERHESVVTYGVGDVRL